MPQGRPSLYSQSIADAICDRITGGESLRSVCRDEDMPDKSTVLRWLGRDEYQGFRDQYARACELRSEHWGDEILNIADDDTTDVQRAKLRVDTRKWLMSKMAPKKYGDRVSAEITGKDGGPVQVQVIRFADPSEQLDS